MILVMLVSMKPGPIALTRTPAPARAYARLLAEHPDAGLWTPSSDGADLGGERGESRPWRTIEPEPCATIRRPADWMASRVR